MPTSTMVEQASGRWPWTSPPADDEPTAAMGPVGRSTNRGRRWPVVAMLAGGLACAVAAGVAFDQMGGSNAGGRTESPAVAAPAPEISSLSLGDISVLAQVYQPGEDSGWHRHAGVHAVTILSGTLTVYDDQCRRQTFGPGEPYIGGQFTHLAVNETTVPVEMSTTYVSPPASPNLTQHSLAPAGCLVGR